MPSLANKLMSPPLPLVSFPLAFNHAPPEAFTTLPCAKVISPAPNIPEAERLIFPPFTVTTSVAAGFILSLVHKPLTSKVLALPITRLLIFDAKSMVPLCAVMLPCTSSPPAFKVTLPLCVTLRFVPFFTLI